MQAVNYIVRNGVGGFETGAFDSVSKTLSLNVGDYSAVSLNLDRGNVSSFLRSGDNLVITLTDGRQIILEEAFIAQAEGTQIFFSANGEIHEITFREAWGRTTYAQYGEADAISNMVFDGTGGTLITTGSDALIATGATVETTMAAAPVFAAGATASAAASPVAAIVSGAVGASVIGAGVSASSGSSGGSGGPNVPTTPVLAENADISISSVGGGSDQIINFDEMTAGPIVTGATHPNSQVTVVFGNTTLVTTSDDDGNYTVAFPSNGLPQGETATTISAHVLTDSGASDAVTADVWIDTTVNAAISGSTVENDGIIQASETSDGIVVTGTAEAGSHVVVTFLGTTRAVTAADDGTWAVTFSGAVAAGVNDQLVTISAEVTDVAGNVTTVTDTVTVDTVLNITIDDIQALDNIINRTEAENGVTFTGTTDPGSSVTLQMNGVTVAATVDANGNWAADFPSGGIPAADVELTVYAHATDPQGNATSTSHVVTIDNTGMVSINNAPLEIDDVINATEAADGVVVTGTTVPGSTVVVFFHSFTGNATVDANGNWFVTVPADHIDHGEYEVTITATATTPTGNVSTDTETVRVDTTVGEMILGGGAVSGDNFVNTEEFENGVSISGTVEPGSSVTVSMAGVTHTAVVAADGTWTVTFLATEIPDGEYTAIMEAVAVDTAGNETVITQTVQIDTVASQLEISQAPIEGDGTINAAEASDGLEINGVADPGAQVTVMLNGVAYTTTATATGAWAVHFTPEDIGTGEITAPLIIQTTDDAGNTTTVESEVEIDTAVSNVSTPDAGTIAGDGVFNLDEISAGVVFGGTAEPGAQVTVAVGNTQFTAVADTNGVWSIMLNPSAFPSGEVSLEITTTITDSAGNTHVDVITSSVDSLVNLLTVDHTSMHDLPAGQDALNAFVAQTGIVLSGTVEIGSTVAVTFEDTTKLAHVDAMGNWSITFSGDEVPVGEYTTNALIVATDAAGNNAHTTASFTLDTSIPEAPTAIRIPNVEAGIWDALLPNTQDTYTVNAVSEDAETTRVIDYTAFNNPTVGGMQLNFSEILDYGTDLIISLDDDAGNHSSTLFVLDVNENPQVNMGSAGYAPHDIEAVDMTFAADANLTITASQLENMSDIYDSLLIRGGSDDTVTAIGAVQTNQTEVIDGQSYTIYTMGSNGAYMVVDDDITMITS
ncbi:MAG: Ig-like domain repeat protein [Planktomarina sp.]